MYNQGITSQTTPSCHMVYASVFVIKWMVLLRAQKHQQLGGEIYKYDKTTLDHMRFIHAGILQI